MKCKLELDWHEEEYIFLRFGVDVSAGATVEVPDDLVARRDAAWKELSECERLLRELYHKQLQLEKEAREAAEYAEWKANAPQREALQREAAEWEKLKLRMKDQIRIAMDTNGLTDTTVELLLHDLDYGSKERHLMINLINVAKKQKMNSAIHAWTPEAIAKREERRKKREAALLESTPAVDGVV